MGKKTVTLPYHYMGVGMYTTEILLKKISGQLNCFTANLRDEVLEFLERG